MSPAVKLIGSWESEKTTKKGKKKVNLTTVKAWRKLLHIYYLYSQVPKLPSNHILWGNFDLRSSYEQLTCLSRNLYRNKNLKVHYCTIIPSSTHA